MKRIRLGLALAAALITVPAVTAARAAGPHTPVSNDGQELAAGETTRALGMSARISPSGEGTSLGSAAGAIEDALAQFGGGESSPEEMLILGRLPAVHGPGSIESIIGPDERTRISATSNFPFRAVVLIQFSAGRCTGWMIGPDTVATAGHCVSPGNNTGFYPLSSFKIFPGKNGSASPFGSCNAKRLYSVTAWTQTGADDYDYAAIKLKCKIGNTVGWFGMFWTTASLKGLPTTITGYPGDKPLTMWRAKGKVTVSQTRRVFYKNDTVGGMSGAPVYYNHSSTCNPCSMAVHAYGVYGSAPFSTNNHGTRITKQVFDNLLAWRNAK